MGFQCVNFPMDVRENFLTVKRLATVQLPEPLCDLRSESFARHQQVNRRRDGFPFRCKPSRDHKLSHEIGDVARQFHVHRFSPFPLTP
jgi:hypothetical protein